jgi:uncharacterized RDD family membrane protein YckC
MKTESSKPEEKNISKHENASDNAPDLDLPGERLVKVNANVLRRFLAFLLDVIILSLLTLPIQGFMKVEQKETFGETLKAMMTSPELGSKMLIAAVFFAIIAILYFTILEYMMRQSVGKMMFRVYVESLTNEGRMTMGQSFLRNLFLIPFIPFSIIAIADPIFMLWTKENQRLSEIICKTKVVEFVRV